MCQKGKEVRTYRSGFFSFCLNSGKAIATIEEYSPRTNVHKKIRVFNK